MSQSASKQKVTMMTVNDINKIIVNKRDLYEALVRNEYYLPKEKSSIITEEWMR